jgi:hypothetical protein
MDCIAEYISAQYKAADENRRDLNSKWEDNRADFNGNLGSSSDAIGTNNQWKKKEGEGWRSKTYPSATHQKVISALAIVLDTVLSGGKLPFMYKPSPYNKHRIDVGGIADPKIIDSNIGFMTDLTQQQLSECKAEREFMKNCLSQALYGWTYSKMLVRETKRSGWKEIEPAPMGGITDWSRVKVNKKWERWVERFNAPAWGYVPVWDIFRDWETDDLELCEFIIHRQIVNNWWLKQKTGKPFFINENLEKAIKSNKRVDPSSGKTVENNEDTSNMSPIMRDFTIHRVNTRQYLEHWGRIPRSVIEEFERSLSDKSALDTYGLFDNDEDEGDDIEVNACVVGGEDTVRLVKTVPEIRPFCQAKWEDSGDEFLARGVADNCHDGQMMLKGALRGIEDNIKMAGNVILALKERLIKNMPAELVPGAKIILAEECQSASEAVQQVAIADMTRGLGRLLEIARQLIDDDSLVPRIASGMIESVGQTAREASIRQAQALKYMGMAIRNLDLGLIEPMVEKFYAYNMEDPAVTQGKGNYIVQALGFSSFINRTDRLTKLQQALTMALNSPELNQMTKVREAWTEIQKAMDLDPDQLIKTQEEVDAEGAKNAENPAAVLQLESVKAEVEKTKAETTKAKADAVAKLGQAKDQSIDTHAKEAVLDKELEDFDNGAAPAQAGVVEPAPEEQIAPPAQQEQTSGTV